MQGISVEVTGWAGGAPGMMKAWMSFALANVAGIILHASALVAVVGFTRFLRLLDGDVGFRDAGGVVRVQRCLLYTSSRKITSNS